MLKQIDNKLKVNFDLTKKFLAISLAIVMVLGSIPLGFSEPLSVQSEMGYDITDMYCNNPDLILVIRDNGEPACVFESTAEKLEWEKVLVPHTTKVGTEGTATDIQNKQKMHFDIESTQNQYSHGSSYKILDPIVSFDIPRNVTVGETFSVDYSISWIDENGDPLYPEYAALEDPSWILVKPFFYLPEEFEIVSEGFMPFIVMGDYYSPQRLVLYGGEDIIYNDSKVISGSFHVKFTESMFYDKDILSFYIHKGGENFQLISDGDSIELIPESELGTDFIDSRYPISERYAIYYNNNIETQIWTGGYPNQTIKLDARDLPIHTSKSVEKIQSAENGISAANAPVEPEMHYIPEEGWEGFAEYLRELESRGTDINRQWMEDQNLTEQFILDFTEVYPEFLIDDTDFRFFLLPEANAAHLDPVYIYGYYLVEDKDGNSYGRNNVLACAYDLDITDNVGKDKLPFGNVDACNPITADDGFFYVQSENEDEQGDGSAIDLLMGFELTNDNVEVIINNRVATQFQPAVDVLEDEIPVGNNLINLGNLGPYTGHTLLNNVHEIPSNAHDTLYSKTSFDVPFVTIDFEFKPIDFEYLHGGAIHNNIENTIVAGPSLTNGKKIQDIPAVLLHEYGHHVQHRLYQDSHNSEIPPCSSHTITGFISDTCGWSEGWAWFFAAWILDEPEFSIGANEDIVDIEYTLFNKGDSDAKSFPSPGSFNGAENEAWVAAALWDILDDSAETDDDIGSQESKLWDAFATSDAQTIFEFETDWDSLSGTNSLDSIFHLNSIRDNGVDDPPIPPTDCKVGEICNLDDGSGDGDSGGTAPTAVISDIIILDSGEEMTLDASSSIGDTPLTYFWEQLNNGSPLVHLSDADTSIASFTVPYATPETDETFMFRVTVTNSVSSDQKSIEFDLTLTEKPPVVDIPPNDADNETRTNLFDEQFSSFTNWDDDFEWDDDSPEDSVVIDTNSKVATIEKCTDGDCTLSMLQSKAIDLNGYDDVELSFWVWFGEDILNNDSLEINIAPIQFRQIGSWENLETLVVGDSEFEGWFKTTINLKDYVGDEIVIQFAPNLALQSSTKDSIIQLDAVKIDGITIDETAPVFSNVPSIDPIISNSQSGIFVEYTDPTAYDNGQKSAQPVSCLPSSGQLFQIGVTVVTCTANDGVGNTANVDFDIEVIYEELIDDEAPVLTPPSDKTFEATDEFTSLTQTQIGSATALDDIDSSPVIKHNSTGLFPYGATIILWNATDSSNNVGNATQIITIKDTTDPVILAPDDKVVEATGKFTEVVLEVATVKEIFLDSLTDNSTATSTYPLGNSTVIFTATDSNGNIGENSTKITIQDKTTPLLTAPMNLVISLDDSLLNGNFYDFFIGKPVVSDLFPSWYVNNATTTKFYALDPEFVFPLGDTTILWSANDTSGNIATDTQIITVVEDCLTSSIACVDYQPTGNEPLDWPNPFLPCEATWNCFGDFGVIPIGQSKPFHSGGHPAPFPFP